MKKPDKIVLVCCSFRQGKEPQGKCNKKGAPDLLALIEEGLNDRGVENVMISTTGCLNVCDDGPVVAILPENHWYGSVDEDSLEDILDAVEAGEVAEEHLITEG